MRHLEVGIAIALGVFNDLLLEALRVEPLRMMAAYLKRITESGYIRHSHSGVLSWWDSDVGGGVNR
jgi:hypothetical protein